MNIWDTLSTFFPYTILTTVQLENNSTKNTINAKYSATLIEGYYKICGYKAAVVSINKHTIINNAMKTDRIF
jgi:hypothetical protein